MNNTTTGGVHAAATLSTVDWVHAVARVWLDHASDDSSDMRH